MKSYVLPFLLILPLFLTWAEPKTSDAPFLTPEEAITKMKTLKGFEVKAFVAEPDTVSYTHLTLPTILLV